MYGLKHGSEIHLAEDRATLRRECAELLEIRNFRGDPLAFIEPVDASLLPVLERDGYRLVRHPAI